VTLGEIRVRESDVRTAAGPVMHGLNTKGSRHLLVPLADSETPIEDRRSAGVQIHVRSLLEGSELKRYLDVLCLRPDLNQLYSTVADEMLAGIEARPDDAGTACRDVLDRWRELLESPRQNLLGVQRQAALLAELEWVTMVASISPEAALTSWRGPLMDRQDFMTEGLAVEVKATLVREGRFTEVHGDRQLEVSPGGDLYLAFHRYEPVAKDGTSLPEQIERLIGAGVERKRLRSLLSQVGYDPRDTDTYAAFRFARTEFRVYPVDAAFPKVVPASFAGGVTPERVGAIRYVIDLEGEPPTPIDAASIDRVVAALALP
jgi:hypothetical protein